MIQRSPQCWTRMFFYNSLEWTNQTLTLERAFCVFFYTFLVATVAVGEARVGRSPQPHRQMPINPTHLTFKTHQLYL